ncbi:MAG: hypothetical protein LBM93_09385 [Oscillospiraceae bacterium]|jgi:hypothetical protein|nr:hypothetical protein [Oscillospiraceae bacterium]
MGNGDFFLLLFGIGLVADEQNKDITQVLQEYFARAMGERRVFKSPLLCF